MLQLAVTSTSGADTAPRDLPKKNQAAVDLYAEPREPVTRGLPHFNFEEVEDDSDNPGASTPAEPTRKLDGQREAGRTAKKSDTVIPVAGTTVTGAEPQNPSVAPTSRPALDSAFASAVKAAMHGMTIARTIMFRVLKKGSLLLVVQC
jgi:hypothetical protein